MKTQREQLDAWITVRGGEMVIERADKHGNPIPARVTMHDERDGVTYSTDLEPTEGLTDRLRQALKEAKEAPKTAKPNGEKGGEHHGDHAPTD